VLAPSIFPSEETRGGKCDKRVETGKPKMN
jgi:hypothetical protein